MDHVHAKVIGDNQIMHVSLCKQIFTVGQVFCFTYVDSREAAVQNIHKVSQGMLLPLGYHFNPIPWDRY